MPFEAGPLVAAGAAFLDAKQPDWLDRINPDAIRWERGKGVLAQIFGSYHAGRKRLGLDFDRAIALGFIANDRGPTSTALQLDELDAEWSRMVNERRAA